MSLPELIVALGVGALLLHLALTTSTALARLSRQLDERAEILRAMAVAEAVLRDEVRRSDVSVWPDSLRLRAVRGVAVTCGAGDTPDEVVAAWRGARLPDPRKDSVEFVTSTGLRRVARLVRSAGAPGRCDLTARNGEPRTMQTEPPPPPGTVLLRVFESGSYHLSDAALRYRAGRGGRQPLTGPVFDPRASGFARGDLWLGVDLVRAGGVREGILHLDSGARSGR